MADFLPGFVMSFREGLEAFLIITVILKFLENTGNRALRRNVGYGAFYSVLISGGFGFLLYLFASRLKQLDTAGKIWESAASLIAVALVITFIVWIIRHGADIRRHIETQAALRLSAAGITALTTALIAREGVEVAIFSFAGKYTVLSVAAGLGASLVLALLVYWSLIRISLRTVFSVTLVYLILQAGYLFGYGLHEGLSALKATGALDASSPLLVKLFDVSGGMLNHKEAPLGIAMNVLFGWYSKPEIVQFAAQYIITGALFAYWWKRRRG